MDERTEIEPGPTGLPTETIFWSDGFREDHRINARDLTSNVSLRFQTNLTEDITFEGRVGHDVFDRQIKTVRARGEIFEIPTVLRYSQYPDLL